MPLPFTLIPELIQVSVVEKLEVLDFPKFVQSSRDAYQISQKIKSRIVLNGFIIGVCTVDGAISMSCFNSKMQTLDASLEILLDFPFRFFGFLIFQQTLTNEICEQFLDYLYISKSRFHCLDTWSAITCSLNQFNALLELSGVKTLHCSKHVESAYFTVEGIKHLEHLTCNSNLNDEQFCSLRIPSICILSNIWAQWLNGERSIAGIRIKKSRTICFNVMLEGIAYSVRESDEVYYILV